MDRIKLNYRKYRLFGRSERWKNYREQAILDIKEHWKSAGKYYEPSGTYDYFQLYDSWDQSAIQNGLCRFVVDAGDAIFTICSVGECTGAPPEEPIEDFDELILGWRSKLSDPSIQLSPIPA